MLRGGEQYGDGKTCPRVHTRSDDLPTVVDPVGVREDVVTQGQRADGQEGFRRRAFHLCNRVSLLRLSDGTMHQIHHNQEGPNGSPMKFAVGKNAQAELSLSRQLPSGDFTVPGWTRYCSVNRQAARLTT
jgi:hypothetical protein